jgi:hypothetical protein
MLKVFIISVGIAFSIQIVHSVLTKGVTFTLEFFGGCFLFGFVREFIYFSFIRTYEFPHMPIKLLNVPIFIPIGWIFTFYLAYEFINNKLIEPKSANDYKDFVVFAAFFSTFICIPIETAAMNMKWWSLHFSTDGNIAPFYLMSGWFATSALFFSAYFVVKKKMPREQFYFVVFLLIVILASEFHIYVIGLLGWAILIIGFAGMFKYNKEITVILILYFIFCFISTRVFPIPNSINVIILFTSIFIYIFAKLFLKNVREQ